MSLFNRKKKKSSKSTVLVPKRERVLTPSEYLQDVEIHGHNIVDTQYLPPKIGSSSYGKFRVIYDTPLLVSDC